MAKWINEMSSLEVKIVSTLQNLKSISQLFSDIVLFKELIIGSDIQDILGKRPADRTEEEIQQVLFALRTYETFSEYPLGMQVMHDIFKYITTFKP